MEEVKVLLAIVIPLVILGSITWLIFRTARSRWMLWFWVVLLSVPLFLLGWQALEHKDTKNSLGFLVGILALVYGLIFYLSRERPYRRRRRLPPELRKPRKPAEPTAPEDSGA